jgi:hypothetical protein
LSRQMSLHNRRCESALESATHSWGTTNLLRVSVAQRAHDLK